MRPGQGGARPRRTRRSEVRVRPVQAAARSWLSAPQNPGSRLAAASAATTQLPGGITTPWTGSGSTVMWRIRCTGVSYLSSSSTAIALKPTVPATAGVSRNCSGCPQQREDAARHEVRRGLVSRPRSRNMTLGDQLVVAERAAALMSGRRDRRGGTGRRRGMAALPLRQVADQRGQLLVGRAHGRLLLGKCRTSGSGRPERERPGQLAGSAGQARCQERRERPEITEKGSREGELGDDVAAARVSDPAEPGVQQRLNPRLQSSPPPPG